ncbi:MAG: ferredoxin--nitrite reductase [Clostridiaceae bacterium BRH_c20a]|nr:MAG: ferredoxin--nitrite reductase [Clostridiaceae bacterium BRH_c20a]
MDNILEKKLNKVELIKLRKDGLELIKEINQYASQGYNSISKEEIELLKWLGLYEQNSKDGHFLFRVRIPSGIMTSEQARVLAQISKEYGRNQVELTTRQCIQFHWVRVENMPKILEQLDSVGLSSFEACGDCPRNITGNPLAGIDHHELFDTRKIVDEVEKYFILNKEFSNLPRKFKISISANMYNSGYAELNDLAFTPAIKHLADKKVIGFHVWVGGGLSHSPKLAKRLNLFVTPKNVLKVAKGVCTIFRDYGYRTYRSKARLKYLVEDWGIERFEKVLINLIGETPKLGEDKILGYDLKTFTGIYPQKQSGLYYLGLTIPNGRMASSELKKLASIADRFGNSTIRLTISKDVLITHVRKNMLNDLFEHDVIERYLERASFNNYAVNCTGKEFCSKAIVRTKPWMQAITRHLDGQFLDKLPIRLHMSGCPSSCGQTQIADIGLQGTVIKTENGPREAFEIFIGGNLGQEASLAQRLEGRIPGEFTPLLIEKFINLYFSLRNNSESFYQCIKRVGTTPFQNKQNEVLALGNTQISSKNDEINKVI